MPEHEAIWKRARADHTCMGNSSSGDALVWEHCSRVARMAPQIAAICNLESRELDRAAVVAAALYHDVGWLVQLREGKVERAELLSRPTCDEQRALGARMLTERMKGLLGGKAIKTAATVILRLFDRDVDLIEARLVADADNLDQIGLLALWPTIRRQCVDNRAVDATIATWHRQTEYAYWEARINDSFHFAPARRLARRRLERLSAFMAELDGQHRGKDLEVVNSVGDGDRHEPRS